MKPDSYIPSKIHTAIAVSGNNLLRKAILIFISGDIYLDDQVTYDYSTGF